MTDPVALLKETARLLRVREDAVPAVVVGLAAEVEVLRAKRDALLALLQAGATSSAPGTKL